MKKHKLLLYSGILCLILGFVLIFLNSRYTFDLYGDKEIIIYKNNEYSEPGYILKDDNKLLSKEVEINTNLDITKVGTYKIEYKYKNKKIERNIKVVEDQLDKYEFKIIGENPVNLELYSNYKDKGFICKYNNKDCSNLVKTSNNVDVQILGSYKIIYKLEVNGQIKKLERIVNVIEKENIEEQSKVIEKANIKIKGLYKKDNNKQIDIKSIKINKKELTLEIGKQYNLKVTIDPNNATNKKLNWSSSDNDVVSVKNGIVKGLKEGTSIITVKTNNNIIDTCEITVIKTNENKNEKTNENKNNNKNIIDVENIIIDKNVLTLYVGESYSFKTTIYPNNATNKKITYSSNNTNIAIMNSNTVKALKSGSAIITAKSNNGKISTCNLTVKEKKQENNNQTIDISNIQIDPKTLTLYVGDSYNFNTFIDPSNATNKTLTYTSSNTSVATMNNNTVKALKAGTVTITVKSNNGKVSTCTLTVKEKLPATIDVTSVKLDKTELILYVGETYTFTTTISPNNATNKKLTYTSSNTNAVSISNNKITAVKAGSSVITVKSNNGKTNSCKVQVITKGNPIMIYFFNTQKNDKIGETYTSNQSIFIQANGKYILIDSGNDSSKMRAFIKNQIKNIEGKDNIVIDYFILSHYHDDHYGNIETLIKTENVTIKNMIIKKNSRQYTTRFNNLVKLSNSYKINLIISNNDLKEGQKINLGSTNMYLYNVADVYLNKDCSGNAKALKWSTDTSKAIKYNSKYLYIDGSTYPNLVVKETSKIIKRSGASGVNEYFYAVETESKNACTDNGNSIALLFETFTKNGYRYSYIPSDLENVGYSIYGDDGIYGTGTTDILKSYKVTDGKLNNKATTFKYAGETIVANQIKKQLGSNLKNIVIYQAAHHGYNSPYDAMKILNINRSNVYSIFMNRTNLQNDVYLYNRLTYHKELSNTKKFATGEKKDKNGVKCYVTYEGSTNCGYY